MIVTKDRFKVATIPRFTEAFRKIQGKTLSYIFNLSVGKPETPWQVLSFEFFILIFQR